MVDMTSTVFTSFTTTIITTSHSHLTTTLFIPTTLVTTIVTTLITVFPTATDLGIPTTVTFTTIVPITSIAVRNVNLNPAGPLVGIYLVAVSLALIFGFLNIAGHRDNQKLFWNYYMYASAVIWVFGLIATILSKTVPPDNEVVHELWAVHFNIACDVIAVIGAGFGFIWSIITDLLEGNHHLFALTFLTFVCAAVGLFSSICSLHEIKETAVGKAGGWYIGMLMWLIGLVLFFISEYIFAAN